MYGLRRPAAARSGTAVRSCSSSPSRYDQGGYGQPYGGPQAPASGGFGGMMGGGGGGGSFLGTAAATAAGMVGGSLLLNSFRGMMGGNRQAFGETANVVDRSPWSDQSNSSLARDAGVNDIGSREISRHRIAPRNRLRIARTTTRVPGCSIRRRTTTTRSDMDMDSDDLAAAIATRSETERGTG